MTLVDTLLWDRDDWFWRSILKRATSKTHKATLVLNDLGAGLEMFHNALNISACRAPGEEESK